ncbi:hypothetical protein K431DRAFT_214139 [Polychaeton citri CBS 116435]|uniref:Tachykinin family protein n=1 Tax=Polychaeton citri CBS 116435 TaxID=1314669 RepID=A0A9P4QF80_9PEZI|nr:hypothetical protein K431DRAFT_214139 [Polychaeton citri CBS 116435]
MSMPDPFLFVPITQDEAAKGRGSTKRIVRAHVTRVQHARSAANAGQELHDWTVQPQTARRSSTTTNKRSASAISVTGTGNVKPKAAPSKQSPHNPIDDEELTISSKAIPAPLSRAVVRKTRPVVLPLPSIPVGSAAADPFWTYPAERLAFIPTIIHHYVLNVAVDIPDIDGPGNKGLLRTAWFPLVMTEPATFYAVLLMAASHYCAIQPEANHIIDLLNLKTRALKAINVAIMDPKRAKSDATIGAVAKMAAYEAVFGDSDTFSAHLRGLQMMLRMRGGLSELGLNGLLERLLVWIDLNAAHITGREKGLGNENFPTIVAFDAPDPFHFAGIS